MKNHSYWLGGRCIFWDFFCWSWTMNSLPVIMKGAIFGRDLEFFFPKYTPEDQHRTWKWWFGRWFSSSGGPIFSGSMLIFQTVVARFLKSRAFKLQNSVGFHFLFPLHSGKPTWQWNMDPLKMNFLWKMGICPCYASLAEGRLISAILVPHS